jgi:hypothetical protein
MTATDYGLLPSALSAIDVRRLQNDAIKAKARGFDGSRSADVGFMCECGSLSCLRTVWRSLAEYDAAAPGSVRDH